MAQISLSTIAKLHEVMHKFLEFLNMKIKAPKVQIPLSITGVLLTVMHSILCLLNVK